ncbi:MAG: class I SAM-dependent methyltransferase [Planctomycetales bacterium]|nr:class I SAM-dependent methyltransferase [Planctomycetales bacterium]
MIDQQVDCIEAMDVDHLDELIQLQDSYWWHIAKRRLACSLLDCYFPAPARVVEGGVGSARNLLAFRDMGYEVAGFDIMPEAVSHAHGCGLHDVTVHDLSEPWPLASESVDAVVLLDVIEHIENPVAVLQSVREALKPGGGAIVTVPAYPWLYGDWDRQLGHFRRYTSAMLREQVAAAGLRVEWLRHWNAFSLPPALVVRGYQRFAPRNRAADFPRVSPLVNRALLACASVERWCLVKKMPAPFGLSLVGVLVK